MKVLTCGFILQGDPHLLSFRVALEHKGTVGGFALLASLSPVLALHHESHQPAVLLVGCKLGHVLQLELDGAKMMSQ